MHRRQFHACCAASALSLNSSAFVLADEKEAIKPDKGEWGNLTATFLYDGDPPAQRKIDVDKDAGAFKLPIYFQNLVVDPKSRGIANCLVWYDVPKGERLPVIHPSYEELAKKEAVIKVANAEIVPHVTAMWTRQTLRTKSSDHVGHNSFVHLKSNQSPGELIPSTAEWTTKYERPEDYPAPISCSIHPWMSGHLLVKDHPYFGISNQQGKLTIRDLPVGKHTFVLWHEMVGTIKRAKRGGKEEKWKQGRLTVDIKPGNNDLGEIVFKPEWPKR